MLIVKHMLTPPPVLNTTEVAPKTRTRRPRCFYLVAAWCTLALFLQFNFVTRKLTGGQISVLGGILLLIATGFVIWQTIGLFLLRRFHLWFAVMFCSWWAVTLVWNSIFFLGRLSGFILVCFALNALSVWYLARRTFREMAVQFVAEHDNHHSS